MVASCGWGKNLLIRSVSQSINCWVGLQPFVVMLLTSALHKMGDFAQPLWTKWLPKQPLIFSIWSQANTPKFIKRTIWYTTKVGVYLIVIHPSDSFDCF